MNKHADDTELTGGQWVTRGLIRVWTGPRPVDSIIEPDKRNRKTIEEMYADGWTDQAMADYLGITIAAVRKRRQSRGLKRHRPSAKCGTDSGYKRHINHKTRICEPCREAHRLYNAQREGRAA